MGSQIIKANFEEAQRILNEFLRDESNINNIEISGNHLLKCLKSGKKILVCGNGGSMSDSMHFAEEFTGRFKNNRVSFPCIAISDPAYLSCVANDFGYENVFSRFVEGIGNKGDVLLVISTSGNSQNVVNAVHCAREKGMLVIALTGKDGGKLASICDIEIRAPYSNYSDRAQEIHIKVLHSLIDYVENNI